MPGLIASGFPVANLVSRLQGARGRLDGLAACLPETGWLGPRAEQLNPPRWEYGHVVWFQERWCLRTVPGGMPSASRVAGADALYDSSAVAHDTRWDLPLLTPDAAEAYGREVLAATAERLEREPWADLAYYAELALYHELMHVEAWWMMWQFLGYPPPHPLPPAPDLPAVPGRLVFPPGTLELGSEPEHGFLFDNEKWRHPVGLAGFDIDATPVTEAAYAAFVEAGGYRRAELWSEEGRAWLAASGARHPVYWRPEAGGWAVRRFQRWTGLAPATPLLHVNRFEAEAYAAWRGRRLPSAAEWQRASPEPGFLWGLAWEWTRDPFRPYPGFAPDPYADYSRPWFHTHAELRGGGPATDAALRRPGFRNFYLPHRRDAFAGFRTAGPS
jgi:ergothioneine biosynthesis protein EgtB